MRENQKCRKEGITYETNIGLRLSLRLSEITPRTVIHFLRRILELRLIDREIRRLCNTTLKTRPTLYGELENTSKPVSKIIFDFETSERSPDTCEVRQISALVSSGHSLEKSNRYVLPEGAISHQASQVHGLKITFSEGKGSHANNGEVVNSVTI